MDLCSRVIIDIGTTKRLCLDLKIVYAPFGAKGTVIACLFNFLIKFGERL
ncbi:conserved hypothetical protein [Escherichia coli]|nr:conserved hypothetical protein [Escherichia coli]